MEQDPVDLKDLYDRLNELLENPPNCRQASVVRDDDSTPPITPVADTHATTEGNRGGGRSHKSEPVFRAYIRQKDGTTLPIKQIFGNDSWDVMRRASDLGLSGELIVSQTDQTFLPSY